MTTPVKPSSGTPTALIQSVVRDILRVLGKQVAALVGVTILTALLEGMAIALLLPLFGALGVATGRSADILTRALAGLFAMFGLPYSPLSVGCVLLAVLMTSGAMFLLQAYYSTRLQAEYVAHWRRRLFEALTGAHWSLLRRLPGGDVTAALTTEAVQLDTTFWLVNLAFSSSTAILLQIAIAFVIAPVATGIILLFGLGLFLLTLPLIHRAIAVGTALTESNATFQARVNELTSAMKLIKATAVEGAANQLLNKSVAELERLNFAQTFDVQIVRAAFEYFSAAAVALLLISGPLLLNVEISTIIVVVAIFVRLFPRITGLRQSVQMIMVTLPGFIKIREITERAFAAREQFGTDTATLGRSGPASVRLSNISVRGDSGTIVLDGIDLDIPAGSYTAISGTSGAGKTTLIDCVLGLVEPQHGQIFVDDVPLRDLSPATWRSGIGYVGQDPILFAGSVRENVTWGATDIDDARVISALSNAGANFVFQLPGGIGAPIAEGGGSLSGGERQRIALARAFYRATWLLILDEATSALDSETESAIAAAVSRLKGRFTVIAVSHRLSSIRDADEIVVLDAGRIIERGQLPNLLTRGGKFSVLWNAQSSAHSDTVR
jgi:ATP-binding cassette subfamily C protein